MLTRQVGSLPLAKNAKHSSSNWRAGASQPSRTTGTIFLFIYLFIYICLPPALPLADPAYKLRYFICDTCGPTRNHGKNMT